MMEYDEFLEALRSAGWSVPNKSFARKDIGDGWQTSFIRMGGKYQAPGKVSFVVCLRHILLRDREKRLLDVVTAPHDYPFKLTFQELTHGSLRYKSKLLNFDMSTLSVKDDWSILFTSLNELLPKQVANYSLSQLLSEIRLYGEAGYIEQIWAEDLA